MNSRGFSLSFVLAQPFLLIAAAGDLSRYRDLQFGMDLPTVAAQTDSRTTQAKVIHTRPVLLQELRWRPQIIGWSNVPDPAPEVTLGFYDGALFRIVIDYDRYETEGLTADDLVKSISLSYGPPEKPPLKYKPSEGVYGDQLEILARWQDADYRFDLLRSDYGPAYRLAGVVRKLELSAGAAVRESVRLDDKEAPARDAARLATEDVAAKAKLEKARVANKPKFRP